MEFTKEDHEAISTAIRAAEQRTSGQIVCVLAHSSSDYVHIPLLWASVLALCLPWPLIYLTQWSVQRIFLLQIVLFLVIAVLAFWSMPLRLALVPRPVQRARAHRAALEQFLATRDYSHQEPNRRTHLRIARRALRTDHCRRGHRPKSSSCGVAGGD